MKWLNKVSACFEVYIFSIYIKCYKIIVRCNKCIHSFFPSLSHHLHTTYHVLVTQVGTGNNKLKDIIPVFKKLSISWGRQADTHRLALDVKNDVNLASVVLELGWWAVFKVTKSRFVISSLPSLYILSTFQGKKNYFFSWQPCTVVLDQTENLRFYLCFHRSYLNKELRDANLRIEGTWQFEKIIYVTCL